MKQALGEWQQQMAEYKAVMKFATSDEQRAAVQPPSPDEIASKLWRSVCRETGSREETITTYERAAKQGAQQRKKVEKTITRKTYELEEDWAAPAVVWLVQHPEAFAKALENKPQELAYYARVILDSVLHKHYSNPIIAEACPKLAESVSDQGLKILEKIYTQNKDAKAKSCAALALSIMLANPTLASSEGGYARTRSKRIYYIHQALSTAPEDTMFGDVTLTEVAAEQAYRLRYLSTDCIPPRMNLTDMEGAPAVFPQEGKPNLIFFWSPTEELGLSMMSKQQALLKQYPGLTLCPIIPHADREEAARMLQENHISLCYMDDAQGTAGNSYRVSQLPLAILVSANARILYIGYPDMQLQTALDNCFNTSKTAAPAAPRPQAPAPDQAQPSDTAPKLRDMPQF